MGGHGSTTVYVAIVATAAVATFVCAWLIAGAPTSATWLIALLVMGFLASVGRPHAIGPIQLSVSAIVQLSAIPLLGAVGAGVVSAAPVITDRNETVKRIFNAAQRVLLVLGGALAYRAAGGEVLDTTSGRVGPTQLAIGMAAATVAAATVNAALLAGVLQRESARSLLFVIRDTVPRILSSYATSFVAAYILVILWSPAGLGWISALFFLPSIVVIQWSLRQLAGEWRIQHEVLASFVSALDLRHPGATESSRLAADAASAIAAGMGVRPSFVDRVVMGARLREVGMLALEGKPAAIVRRDLATASARLLRKVGFLTVPATYIAGHHERVDGHGWPDGLSREQIPLGSRVLAVADAWSRAVMGGRSAEEAVRVCEAGVGTALDEVCVNALRRAHERGQLPAVEP